MSKWFALARVVFVALTLIGVALTAYGQEGADPNKIEKINLNTATVQQLKTLPTVGDVTAGNIVEHRRVVGPFRSIEELMAVPGIGRKTFAKIRDLITVEEVQSPSVLPSDDPS